MSNYLYPIRFAHSQKNVFFKSDKDDYQVGTKVVCETTKGLELGIVMHEAILNENLDADSFTSILRTASPNDINEAEKNIISAKKALEIFTAESKNYNLDLQPLSCYYTLDRDKIIFTYLATERVDFRELLKTLARIFRTRIDLRQVNNRDRAQFVGGVGVCGLPICCSTFLNDFEGISVQKAKNQMLTINSTKANGLCGKLLCCLKYEDEVYTLEKQDFPPVGTTYKKLGKEYKIIGFNVISRMVKLDSEDGISNESLEEVMKILNPKAEEPKNEEKRGHRPHHRNRRHHHNKKGKDETN